MSTSCEKVVEKLKELTNDCLMLFTNGTFHIKTKTFVPDPNINNFYDTMYPYDANLGIEHKTDVNRILNILIPNPKTRRLFLRLISNSFFTNRNNNKTIFLCGSGHENKAFLLKLLQNTLYNYVLYPDDDRDIKTIKDQLLYLRICVVSDPDPILLDSTNNFNRATIVSTDMPLFLFKDSEDSMSIDIPRTPALNVNRYKLAEFNKIDHPNSSEWKNAFFQILLENVD